LPLDGHAVSRPQEHGEEHYRRAHGVDPRKHGGYRHEGAGKDVRGKDLGSRERVGTSTESDGCKRTGRTAGPVRRSVYR
jgi:hypothetical protein